MLALAIIIANFLAHPKLVKDQNTLAVWVTGGLLELGALHLRNKNLPRAIIHHRRTLMYLYIFKLSHCYQLFYLSFMIDT